MEKFFFILASFVFGALIGSLISSLIYRLRQNKFKSFLFGRSICPVCKKKLRFLNLVPIFSYLWQKGRCTYCHKKISFHYFLLELSSALVFGLTALNFFEQIKNSQNYLLLIIILFYLFILIFTTFYDLLYLEIEDKIMIPAIAIALISSILELGKSPLILNALIGAALIFVFFYAQIFVSKGAWLGGGDLRIGIFMGLILGWPLSLLALILSYFVGSIVSLLLIGFNKKYKLRSAIPFAPFLCFSTFVCLNYGDIIWTKYLEYLGI